MNTSDRQATDGGTRLREHVVAAALYTLLTVICLYPLSIHPASTLPSDSSDYHLFMWTLSWDVHAFVHQPLSIFDANIFFPGRDTLAYSENLIASAAMVAPVLWVTGNPVLAVNLVSIVSCILCGVGAYLLARRIGLGWPAAFVCGIVFAFGPPRFFRFTQLHLTTVQWMPFALACLDGYFEHGRPRDLRLALLFGALQLLSSGHGGIFLIIAAATLTGCRLLLGEPVRWRRWVPDAGAVGVVIVVPVLLLFLPYRTAQVATGLRRDLSGWDTLPQSFLASPTPLHHWLLTAFGLGQVEDVATAYLFPGYLPVLLAALALFPIATRRQDTRVDRSRRVEPSRPWRWLAVALNLVAVAAVACAGAIHQTGGVRFRLLGVVVFAARQESRAWLMAALALVARVAVSRRAPIAPATVAGRWREAWRRWAHRRGGVAVVTYLAVTLIAIGLAIGPPVGLWPLVYWLPGFNFIRVPSRFMILALLGMAVLAGMGFERVTAALTWRARSMAAAIAVALLMAEFVAIPVGTVPLRVDLPAADRWLATQPEPMAIAEIPTSIGARNQSTLMLHSMAHWRKTVHGYSGILPAEHEALYKRLGAFPTAQTIEELSALGVTHVVVHIDWFLPDDWPPVEQRLRLFPQALTLVYQDERSRVYALTRASGR